MYILAKLVFEHYIPEQLEKGMWFKQRIKDIIYGRIYEYDRIFEMNASLPMSPEDFDSFIQMHGYPVKPKIVSITANPDDKADVLATDEQIGWWDDGPQSDELRDIELKDINLVLQEEDGILEIEVKPYTSDDDDHMITPVLFMDKVTLRIPIDDETWEEEDWDDMDDWTHDEPDTDSAGFTPEDRCIKYDADHETE